jgi:hypothetical protein
MLPAEVFATLFAVLMLPVCFMMSPGGGGGAAAEGGGAAAEDDDKEPWEKNPRYLTRTNSPSSRPARSDIWATVRRLQDTHPKVSDGGYTHICTEPGCGCFLKLNKTSGNWGTNPALTHAKRCHTKTSGAAYIKTAENSQVCSFPETTRVTWASISLSVSLFFSRS